MVVDDKVATLREIKDLAQQLQHARSTREVVDITTRMEKVSRQLERARPRRAPKPQ